MNVLYPPSAGYKRRRFARGRCSNSEHPFELDAHRVVVWRMSVADPNCTEPYERHLSQINPTFTHMIHSLYRVPENVSPRP